MTGDTEIKEVPLPPTPEHQALQSQFDHLSNDYRQQAMTLESVYSTLGKSAGDVGMLKMSNAQGSCMLDGVQKELAEYKVKVETLKEAGGVLRDSVASLKAELADAKKEAALAPYLPEPPSVPDVPI